MEATKEGHGGTPRSSVLLAIRGQCVCVLNLVSECRGASHMQRMRPIFALFSMGAIHTDVH